MLHIRVLRACGQLQQAVQRHPTDGNAGEGKPCSPHHSRRPARGSSRRRRRGAGSPWKQKLTDVFGDLLEDGFLSTSTTNVLGHTHETKKPLLADNVTSNVTFGRMTHPRYRHGRNMKTQNLQGLGELQPFRTTPRNHISFQKG